MNKAIVLGSDAVNALGLVQSLGREGVYVIAVLDCKESGLISKSKYAKEIINVTNFEQGIDIISEKYLFEEPAVIFPAGVGAALAIEKSSSRLRGKFLFEHIVGEKGFELYMQKQNQISSSLFLTQALQHLFFQILQTYHQYDESNKHKVPSLSHSNQLSHPNLL